MLDAHSSDGRAVDRLTATDAYRIAQQVGMRASVAAEAVLCAVDKRRDRDAEGAGD
jgi:hypothetical protein